MAKTRGTRSSGGAANYRTAARPKARKTTRKQVGTGAGLSGQKVGVGKAIRPPANPIQSVPGREISRGKRSRRRV